MVHAAVLSTGDGALHGAYLHFIWIAVLDQRYRAYGTLGPCEKGPGWWMILRGFGW